MQGIEYFYELFTGLPRGGPGDNRSTRKAFSFLNDLPYEPLILDIGCGPGMQTLELARISKGKIIALDNYQPFLDILMQNAIKQGLDDRISIKNQSMLEMDFKNKKFDIIWSEGALYQMGFQNGLKKCYQLLKNKGYLGVTEGVLFNLNPPKDVLTFWEEYPDVKDIKSNIALIENEKYHLLTHFSLPKSAWIDNFYSPMQIKIAKLKVKYHNNQVALKILKSAEREIELYKKISDYTGYEFFIMQKK